MADHVIGRAQLVLDELILALHAVKGTRAALTMTRFSSNEDSTRSQTVVDVELYVDACAHTHRRGGIRDQVKRQLKLVGRHCKAAFHGTAAGRTPLFGNHFLHSY